MDPEDQMPEHLASRVRAIRQKITELEDNAGDVDSLSRESRKELAREVIALAGAVEYLRMRVTL